MNAMIPVITIDGPSGTGKGTLAHRLAKKLGFFCLDSGALYRGLAWAVLQGTIDIEKQEALERCINSVDIKLKDGLVICNEVDVSADIRRADVSMMASKIAANPLVRKRLMELQRQQRQEPGLVTDGRDMGTVVFPDAIIKIFLTATAKERALRRYKQLKEKKIDVSLPNIEEELNIRDRQDAERAVSPLKPADDAIVVDTTDMSADQVFQRILDIVSTHNPLTGCRVNGLRDEAKR